MHDTRYDWTNKHSLRKREKERKRKHSEERNKKRKKDMKEEAERNDKDGKKVRTNKYFGIPFLVFLVCDITFLPSHILL